MRERKYQRLREIKRVRQEDIIYIYIKRERDRERQRGKESERES